MTKFSVRVSEFEKSSLSQKQIEKMFSILEKKIKRFQKVKFSLIEEMQKENLSYRLKTIGKNFVIVITREPSNAEEICIGYPFPIHSRLNKLSSPEKFKIKYFLRGQILRNAQKSHFIKKLRDLKLSVDVSELNSLKEFSEKLSICMKKLKPDVLNYIDLYHFLGDSFLSTYMLDAFARDYSIPKKIIYSQSYKHLNGFYNAKPLENLGQSPGKSIFIFSDLLDIDDAFVQNSFFDSQKDGLYIINSRNCFFTKVEKNVHVFSLKGKEDILLTQNNIFDYMKNCIRPFVKKTSFPNINPLHKQPLGRIYINPYSSLAQKSLTIEEIKKLIDHIRLIMPEMEIYIPYGYNDDTKKYTQKIKEKVSKINLIEDNGIYDLYKRIKDNGIDLVITVDTALTHILTKYGIRNIVLYKDGFWDPKSLQSLVAESPIAFCSQYYWQYPFILKCENDIEKICELIGFFYRVSERPVIPDLELEQSCFSQAINKRIRKISDKLGCNKKLNQEFSS